VQPNQLFERSRWQLASWYAGITSLILLLCGIGVYQSVAHAHRTTLDRELESVAGTIHDSFLPVLKRSGKLEPEVRNLLPNICLVETGCNNFDRLHSYRLGAIQQDKYYLRLFDLSQELVAAVGVEPELPQTFDRQKWQTLTDSRSIRYRQIAFLLHTQTGQSWGYLQVGKSLQDFDNYVANVKWILLFGIPLLVALVMVASWWLAELAMRPIDRSYRQMQQFTADAAHELRTPLAAIQATIQADLILPELTESAARNTLTKILRQNKRLSHLVADLLTLCRIDGLSQSQTKREKISLPYLITEVMEELAALAMASKIELISQINISQPIPVMGDRQQLDRLVTNLLTNAIQYTPAGGKVTVSLKTEERDALICIRDTGMGISQEDQKQIFNRFYRVDKARSIDRGGYGLGLSIVIAIAHNHQGTVRVVSEPGKGSLFIVRLPLD
jgi:signal transduction histidine kinase